MSVGDTSENRGIVFWKITAFLVVCMKITAIKVFLLSHTAHNSFDSLHNTIPIFMKVSLRLLFRFSDFQQQRTGKWLAANGRRQNRN